MRKFESLHSARSFIFILFIVLIPLFSYTAFQWNRRHSDEDVIRTLYQRQLESVLFSVNQHCWDEFNRWVQEVDKVALAIAGEEGSEDRPDLKRFLDRNSFILAAFINYSGKPQQFVWRDSSIRQDPEGSGGFNVDSLIDSHREAIQKTQLRARKGYIQPVSVPLSPEAGTQLTWIIFPVILTGQDSAAFLSGLLLDDRSFAEEVIVPKLRSIEDEDVILAVGDSSGDVWMYLGEEEENNDYELSDSVWLLPRVALMIRLRGMTLGQIARARTRSDLIFLAAVNIILILGLLYLLKNVLKEIRFGQLKTDFVANVSHELATPLSLIRVHAETLELGRIRSEDKKKHYYHMIAQESVRLSQMVKNILDFSRIERKRVSYQFRQEDLAELAGDTLNSYRAHLENEGFEVEFTSSGPLPGIPVDRDAVTQAFVNLLDNAVKFSPDHKRIEVCLKKREDSIILSVRDHGLGIPKNALRFIYDPFYRVEDPSTRHIKGSGLGLSLVKHIMEMHGGTVTAESEMGMGSTFTLSFPVPGRSEAS